MTTMKDQIDELGDVGTKIIGYAIIGSTLRILSEGVDELEDEEVIEAVEKLQEMIMKKQTELMDTNI